MQLDPATLIMVQVLGAAISVVVLASAQKTEPDGSTVLAIIGAAMLGMGNLLLLLRGVASDLVSIGLGNALLIGAIAMIHRAYAVHARRRRLTWWPLALSAGAALVFIVAASLGADYVTRVVMISFVLAAVCIAAAVELARDRGLSREPTRRFSFALMILAAICLVVRIPLALVTGPEGGLFVPSLEKTVAFIPGIVVAISFGVGFVLMQMERAVMNARELATTDALTGSMNRRALLERATAELADAARTGLPCALIVLDLDHFKSLNDQYGHAAGDRVLRQVALTVENDIRPADIFARYGGEEFCVFLRATDTRGAVVVAERLRRRIAEARLSIVPGEEALVTVSIGVACTHGRDPDAWDVLFGRADEALYEAKAQGRNKVKLARGRAEAKERDLPVSDELAPA